MRNEKVWKKQVPVTLFPPDIFVIGLCISRCLDALLPRCLLKYPGATQLTFSAVVTAIRSTAIAAAYSNVQGKTGKIIPVFIL